MTSQRIGYIRVSSLDPERRAPARWDFIWTRYSPARHQPRIRVGPNFRQRLITFVQGIYSSFIPWLGWRNVEDMLSLVREMKDPEVSIEFIKENMSFTAGDDDPRSILMFTVLSADVYYAERLRPV